MLCPLFFFYSVFVLFLFCFLFDSFVLFFSSLFSSLFSCSSLFIFSYSFSQFFLSVPAPAHAAVFRLRFSIPPMSPSTASANRAIIKLPVTVMALLLVVIPR